jgi:protein adenylyltransferase SelO-like protein
MAYAGHRFGHFVPQPGDGRAILLGEIVDRHGVRRDVQLKGSSPTPFSRRGDGRAALGSVLREYIVSEAMTALGIPSTRVLNAHPPDQCAEVRLGLRPPSPRTRLPTPVATEACTMPPHEGLRTDDREDLQDRRKPSIQLDKEPAIVIRQPNPATNITPQNDRLM